MPVRLSAALAALALMPLLVLVLAGLAPASADCVAAEFPPAGSPVIFSGTAVEERGTYTKFEVERVWEGPDLAEEVWVQGGQEQESWPFSLLGQVMSSLDAEFDLGEHYVVGAADDFSTTICSVTDAEAHEVPADARTPVEGGAQGADVPLSPWIATLLVAGAAAGVLTAAVVLVRRRRAIAPG
ncbi:hypothetical protein [Nocardioides jishulii]|uniref:LPXTG cell wall anchor domain-containing protein n=1 Tax=Nocardioides jishulii TaxID=2575440 RepID=A0A4U2YTD0_9ACTN|nr:hypothetical protein [Nocardioides jishulii]QCX26116.1 hypothetical protein FCL41_00085 [Nocardioides jishulii]TKI64085.1 hypothetical protein FC770_02625 [Nocardioides jishulii]